MLIITKSRPWLPGQSIAVKNSKATFPRYLSAVLCYPNNTLIRIHPVLITVIHLVWRGNCALAFRNKRRKNKEEKSYNSIIIIIVLFQYTCF